jgi:hypothetical protein
MAERADNDPYQESGHDAAASTRQRMKSEQLIACMKDAEQLELRGHMLIARGRRMTYVSVSVLIALIGVGLGLMFHCMRAYDGSYEGALAGNWSMLGALMALGAANFAWGWVSSQRRLADLGRRLIGRAEYQRRIATLQLQEVPHEAVS